MAGDNEPHMGTPDEGMQDEAESTDDVDEASYVDANHGDGPGTDDADDDAEDGPDEDGHYVESDEGSGHHDTHPGQGEYVERDDEDGVPPD